VPRVYGAAKILGQQHQHPANTPFFGAICDLVDMQSPYLSSFER
jgi:hypothetical protein